MVEKVDVPIMRFCQHNYMANGNKIFCITDVAVTTIPRPRVPAKWALEQCSTTLSWSIFLFWCHL